MSVEENLRIMKSVDEVFETKDWTAFDERHSADVLCHSPMTPEPTRGIGPHREAMERIMGAFSDFRLKAERGFGQDDWVAIEYTMTGTHDGPLHTGEQVIPPTNRQVCLPVNATAKLVDGKIVEEHIVYDRLAMMIQLGVMKPPSQE